tara:strand:- start:4369 stop:6756 length:2388 start_codon:yes stop_codon:yes gene_type:complete
MKNKFFIIFLFCSIFNSHLLANPFSFETAKIEVLEDGNKIYAIDGKAISFDKNLEIEAAEFEYFKNLELLKAYNGIAFIKSDNLKIEFNKIDLDQKKFTLEAKENVKIFETQKKLSIESDLVTYNWKTKILNSKTHSILKDQFNNVFDTQAFNYEAKKNILKIVEANFKDFDNNSFYTKLAYINTLTNQLIGKDISIDLNNKSFNEDNEPRLKGKTIIYDNETTEVSKGVFTTCKKTDKCPPWQLSAEKIQHNKKKKVINYKNAWLKVYDVPVMYFPKFFHPDPTVDRRSGFLIPTIKNSPNADNYLSVPYFYAMGINKDMTFTPRFYTEDKLLLQSEYRQVNLNSSHLSDFSIYREKDNNSKSHFFYKYNKLLSFDYFQNSNFDLNIEKTSNDTYLRASKLKSPLINEYDVLENSVNLSLKADSLSIESDLIIYEDLTKKKNSDKFEYILPKINITKQIENKTKLNGNFSFISNNLVRNYQTNIFEKTNINDLIFNSNPKITNHGFYNNYDFIIKNVNSDTQNSDDFKENENYYLSGLFQFNSSLPMIKENNNLRKILKPKLAIKISPNDTKDISDSDESRLDVNNIYDLNRLASDNTVEGGFSLTYGNDFTIFNKEDSRELFGLKIANNLRIDENDDLPRNYHLGQKTSNFFGEITYNPIDSLSLKYNTSTKNNIKDVDYQNLITEISINNFVTTFDYLNENNTTEQNSYLLNTTKYELNDSNSISFSTRENKTSDLTEYYNLMYQYKNDCLSASIEYNKDYYNDRDIKPEENIFFKLTIIPIGETSSPNLKN